MPLSSSSSSSVHPSRSLLSTTTSDDDLLLCSEGATSLSDDEHQTPRRPVFTTTTASTSATVGRDGGEEEDEEVAAALVGEEANHLCGLGYRGRFGARSGHLDFAARLRTVAWILKVTEFYQFRPVTTYLAVNYMDRFLSCHALPQQRGGWSVQLLAVACLSLAAKMEETLVPSLLDLQVEDATFVFEPRAVQRMELLVLDALNWRLSSITPFAFTGFFACKADPSRLHNSYLVSRATRIILATTEEMEFLDHCPSAVAAAAIICAAREAPALSSISPESAALWYAGLTRDSLVTCYQLMQELDFGIGQKKQQRRLLRRSTSDRVPLDALSSLPSPASSPSSSSSSKRRKLNSCGWVDDGMGSRSTEEGDDIN